MKNLLPKRFAPALAGLGFVTILCAPVPPAHAQFPGPPPDGQFGGGQPGGGGQFGGGGGGQFGGGGQQNRRPPFAAGTVTSVDTASGTLTLSSPFGGPPQVVQTSATTKIMSQGIASLSDLQVGDQVQIQGIPTGISASSVTIGQSPLPFGGGRGPGRPGGNGGPGGGGPGNGGPRGNNGPQVKGQASASGSVTSVKPLTISLGTGISVTLTLAAAAKVTRFSPVSLSSIKVGDKIVSSGQNNDDGTFAATSVGVNVDMGAMGMGRGGPGSFGGPGGGPGGPGGGGFGRGRGNRGQGGPGGFGGPGGPDGGGPGGPGGGQGGPGGPNDEPVGGLQ